MFEKPISCFAGLSAQKKDGICILALTICCLLFFFPVVFCGQSVSRVVNLVNQDFLFHYTATCPPSAYDVALAWMKVDNYLFTAGLWRQGILPFWNPYSGAGSPHLGELQAIVLSPWMPFYVLSPTIQMHNYLLVAQQILGTCGLYLAARALGLTRYAACFAALAHLFCAHQLWRQELQMNYYFYPPLIWSFIRLQQTRDFLWALGAGLFCAATILSGDAQVSLLCIGTASFFFVATCFLDQPPGFSLRSRLISSFFLVLAGLNALCFSAPVLLSFVEYIKCGALSKHSTYYSVGAVAPWESLLYTLVHPGFGGASLYTGCLTLPLAALSFFALKVRKKYYLSVLLTTVIAFMGASRTGFFPLFDRVFDLMGCSRFEGMEPFVVFLCLLLAYGLEELAASDAASKTARIATFTIACVIAGGAPMLLSINHFDLHKYSFDMHIEEYAFQANLWRIDVAILLAMGALYLVCALGKSGRALVLVLAAVLLNSVSECQASTKALPIQPKFKYRLFEPLTFLSQKPETRVVPVGYNLFHPNTNFVYRICSLALHGPIAPLRIHEFINAAGGAADPFNSVFPWGTFPRLIDLASINYLISLVPVRSADEPYTTAQQLPAPVSFKGTGDLKLLDAKVEYDSVKSEFGGYLDWQIGNGLGEKYNFLISVGDQNGKTFWTGGPYYVRERAYSTVDSRKEGFSHVPLKGLITANVPEGKDFVVGIYLQNADMKVLVPQQSGLKSSKDLNLIGLGTFKKTSTKSAGKSRFKLVSEMPYTYIRVYENQNALPRAYIVHETLEAKSNTQALSLIQAPTFAPQLQAVVEEKTISLEKGKDGLSDQVKYSRPDVNTVSLDVMAASKGFLVLTDQFYPGWHVLVDGVEKPLHRANFLFKGVPVEAGRHKVVFYYQPTYLVAGLILLILGALANAAAYVFRKQKQKRNGDESVAAA